MVYVIFLRNQNYISHIWNMQILYIIIWIHNLLRYHEIAQIYNIP